MPEVSFQDGKLLISGYINGATVHGIDGLHAKELRRLMVFNCELRKVSQWLSRIPDAQQGLDKDQSDVFSALADAAIVGFCRCFYTKHPLRPLKQKGMLTTDQKRQLQRLINVRHNLVAHDAQLTSGLYSLIVFGPDKSVIEALCLNIVAPFSGLSELDVLRELCSVVLEWVKNEYERVASLIVAEFRAMPESIRASAPAFTIDILPAEDHFAP